MQRLIWIGRRRGIVDGHWGDMGDGRQRVVAYDGELRDGTMEYFTGKMAMGNGDGALGELSSLRKWEKTRSIFELQTPNKTICLASHCVWSSSAAYRGRRPLFKQRPVLLCRLVRQIPFRFTRQ